MMPPSKTSNESLDCENGGPSIADSTPQGVAHPAFDDIERPGSLIPIEWRRQSDILTAMVAPKSAYS